MATFYKIIFIVKFLFAIVLIFLLFFGIWNLISFLTLTSSNDFIPARVSFPFMGVTAGDYYYKYGYLKDREVRLDNAETPSNEILDVWIVKKSDHYNAYLRESGETSEEFRLKRVFRFLMKLSIWLGIFLILHFITLIIKKNVHIEELPPQPKKNFYDY